MVSAEEISTTVEAANQEAYRRVLAGDPVLVDVRRAGEAIEGLPDRTILHAGPPITWDRMCGPMKSAVTAAIVFESWAKDLCAAREMATSGEVQFRPNHDFNAVGPMTGITTPNMAVMIVENRTFGNRAYCTINEGMGNVMRFGGNDQEVVDRIKWMADELGPALGAALRHRQGIPLKSLIARGLTMGDDMHMRNAACSGLILREWAPALAQTASEINELPRIFQFIAANDMFFLNIAMATAKSMIAAAHGIDGSTIVTTMARNGTEFGIRLSSTGDDWFCAPAGVVNGLFFSGFSEADANPDLGDSCIVETVGLGGFAMAASPAVVGFVGAGTVAEAEIYTRTMAEITVGPNPEWTIPALDMLGVPTGIDVRKVVESGIAPVINTAIAHREPGRGQIGAGVATAPLLCFEKALTAFDKTVSGR